MGRASYLTGWLLIRSVFLPGGVQSFAAIALGKLKNTQATEALFELAIKNNDQDPFLRHSVVMGLLSSPADQLIAAAKHSDASVRMVALPRSAAVLLLGEGGFAGNFEGAQLVRLWDEGFDLGDPIEGHLHVGLA